MSTATERKILAQCLEGLTRMIKEKAEGAEFSATRRDEVDAWVEVLGGLLIVEGR